MQKKIILGISLLMIWCFFVFFQKREANTIMDVPILSEKEILQIKSQRTNYSSDENTLFDICLKINDVPAAYEKTQQCYYIPKNTKENYWKGTLSAFINGESVSIGFAEDPDFQNISNAIQNGKVFTCLIYNKQVYQTVSVLFTGLPLMHIEGEMGENGTWISVFDPILSSRGGYQTERILSYYNIRGNASKRFEKIGYRIEFLETKASLLGMRSDNDWQLKAMYSDKSKLRDKLSIDLWNEISGLTETKADDGCHMEYIELMVNGEYRGLYGLVEPTDYKSLGLDKTKDLIYKAAADEWPTTADFEESEATQSFTCAGISIRQAGKEFYAGIWEPFRTFWDNGYELTEESQLETLYSCIDRQNFINYHLYYNAIAGMDNRYKNIIYSAVLENDGSFQIRRIPWDQNYSWGDDFDSEKNDIKNIRFNLNLASKWLNEEVFRNIMQFDKNLSNDMKQTWEAWRNSFLTEKTWIDNAREQMYVLVSSGAFARDSLRWPDSENSTSTEEIEAYISIRFTWLDNYFQELSEQ